MLLWVTEQLETVWRGFHVFSYITLRGVLGTLTAFCIALWVGPLMIRYLKTHRVGQTIREDGPTSHLSKVGTPTMGGALILVATVATTLLWVDWSNRFIWVVLFSMVAFGWIGWMDDYRKLILGNSKGLSARWKYGAQSILGVSIALYLYLTAQMPIETALIVPFFKSFTFPLGLFYMVLTYFVIVGSSNAVNLADGLDGLAIMPCVLLAGALAIFAYVTGHFGFAQYLGIPYVPGVGELVVFCAALVGAGLGFLWFNAYPAQVFMGDMGSLALGASLGTVAVLVRQEIVFAVMAGVFVMETISVMLQVASYRLTGKRIFRMAPLHHHFELLGWPEPKVIVRFWIVTVVLVLLGLSTLKLR